MTQNAGKRLGQSIHCRENLKNLLPTENSHEQADRLPERRSPTSDSQANTLVPNCFSNWFVFSAVSASLPPHSDEASLF